MKQRPTRSRPISPDMEEELAASPGSVGESVGMLRTSAVKRRVHSLFRQGCLLYDLIPDLPEARLRPLGLT